MSVTSSGATPISASIRSGEIQDGMPNFTLMASPLPSRMKPVSTRTILSARRAKTNENGRSTISSAGAPWIRPAMRWFFERANSRTWTFQAASAMGSAFGNGASETRQPDRDDKDGALQHILREGWRPEDVQAVEAERDDQRADEGAEHVELAVAQGGRAEENR